ncbi:MAG TPA: phytanoyl-CoA dioxygenase family protein, partial [Hyphomicrobiaceae bacterium]|nr:phytanoyl-CoA dioxygenase family protein [Hyphomicrobiaceae bacterium]
MAKASAAQIEAFERDGVVLLPGLLADRVTALEAAVAENMASPFERTYKPDDGGAPFFQDFCNWARIPGYRSAVLESPMAEVAAALMRSGTARFFHDHVLVKEPGNSMKTPWHQDQPYYLVEGEQSVSFWVPLDPVPREIALEYVGGSHRAGRMFRPERFDGTSLYQGDDSERVPDVDGRRAEFNILAWPMQPGDAVAFNFRTLHGAPANTTKNRRRAISFRWVGDDA